MKYDPMELSKTVLRARGYIVVACAKPKPDQTREYEIGEHVAEIWGKPSSIPFEVSGFTDLADYNEQAKVIANAGYGTARSPRIPADFYRMVPADVSPK